MAEDRSPIFPDDPKLWGGTIQDLYSNLPRLSGPSAALMQQTEPARYEANLAAWEPVGEAIIELVKKPEANQEVLQQLAWLLGVAPVPPPPHVAQAADAVLLTMRDKHLDLGRNGASLIGVCPPHDPVAVAAAKEMWVGHPEVRRLLAPAIARLDEPDLVEDLVRPDLGQPLAGWPHDDLDLVTQGSLNNNLAAALLAGAVTELRSGKASAQGSIAVDCLLRHPPKTAVAVVAADEDALRQTATANDRSTASPALWLLLAYGDRKRTDDWLAANASAIAQRAVWIPPAQPSTEGGSNVYPDLMVVACTGGVTMTDEALRALTRSVVDNAKAMPPTWYVASVTSLVSRQSGGLDQALQRLMPKVTDPRDRLRMLARTPYGKTRLADVDVSYPGEPPPHITAQVTRAPQTAAAVLRDYPAWTGARAAIEKIYAGSADGPKRAMLEQLVAMRERAAAFHDVQGLQAWVESAPPAELPQEASALARWYVFSDPTGVKTWTAAWTTGVTPVWNDVVEAIIRAQLRPEADALISRMKQDPRPAAHAAAWLLSARMGRAEEMPDGLFAGFLGWRDFDALVAPLARVHAPELRDPRLLLGADPQMMQTRGERLLGALDAGEGK